MKIKEKKYRNISQYIMALLLPTVIVGGYFNPYLGFIVVGLIVFFMTLAPFRGRFYCGWFCPMGAFHERILNRISLKKQIPELFYKAWFRWFFFAVMMSLLTFRLIRAGSDPALIADAFRFMWIVSTSLAVLLGVFFKARSWCRICPMASMQGLLSQKKYLLRIDESCKECKICQKVCPIASKPYSHKEKGYMDSVECMRCFNCVENCPKKALKFL